MVAEARKIGFFIGENSVKKTRCTETYIQVDVRNPHRIWDAEKHLLKQLLSTLNRLLLEMFLLK